MIFEYKYSVCISVTDGDSAHIELDMGLRIYTRANCRLYGINTPELNSTDPVQRERALAARTRLTELIGGKAISVISRNLDKFGRPLATVFLDGKNICLLYTSPSPRDS